jgi:hypothetical protein
MKRPGISVVLLVALLLYAAAYLALVRRGHVYDMRRPEYAAHDRLCRPLFGPAQWLDRNWFRARYWEPPACVY